MSRSTRPTFRRSAQRAPHRSGNQDWREDAACHGLDVTWFYPDPDDLLAVVRARTFCAACPVRRDCARHAIEHHEHHGIWGGSTAQERAAFRGALSP